MGRFCALILALSAFALWSAPAQASGDIGCGPEWKLAHNQMTGCDNMALLGPGNDTRVNFLLLLADVRGTRFEPASGEESALFGWHDFVWRLYPQTPRPGDPNYPEGEGSRCRSNDSGAAAFEAAIAADRGVPPPERAALVAARKAMRPDCAAKTDDSAMIAATAGVKSPAGKEYARYLAGALAFYDGDFDLASRQFAALDASKQPWLRETACYMLGRVEVNRAQVGAFDEYGFPDKIGSIDPRLTGAARDALATYLRQYPKGRYAVSAQGLMRRVFWLGFDKPRLSALYAGMLAQPLAVRGVEDVALADEIDTKLLPTLTAADAGDPVLLAVLDLRRMRLRGEYAAETAEDSTITLGELQAQRAKFASNPALYEYLLAAHAFHVAGMPHDVLKLIPDAARQPSFSYLQFSRQMLRGMALESLKDRNARGFWLDVIGSAKSPFQRPAAELALAYHDERSGGLDKVFAAGSPVRNREIREILLANVAGPALLRQQARDHGATPHERDLALFTLLYKQLTRGAYAGFLADLALVPADASAEVTYDLYSAERIGTAVFVRGTSLGNYGCPALRETAAQLARNPRASKALLCLADFVRANGFDEFQLDSQPEAGMLGGTKPLFPGAPFSRLELYKGVIADPAAAGPDKAYALYRAINCYATSGNNSCGGTEVPVATRKAWFARLKKDYPASTWAKDLKYYW
jgi:hypothetical protein